MKTIAFLFAVSAACAGCSSRGPSPAPVPEGLTLAERLTRETRGRPTIAPRAEDVVTALCAGGVAVGPLKQVLARTVGARYCAMTRTRAGLGVAVCEFGDAAQAESGMAYSRRTFDRLIPGRRLARNRGTVLTLTPPGPGPRFETEAGRIAALFAAL